MRKVPLELVLAHAVCLVLLPVSVAAFDEPAGRPPVINFEPGDYPDSTWAVAKAPDGLLYVGADSGLWEFDGRKWRHFETPESTVRSIAVAPDGTVFIGGQSVIDMARPDAAGRLSVHSLVDRIAPEDRMFGDVWFVRIVGDDIYFQTFTRLFRWTLAQEPDGPRLPSGSPFVFRTSSAYGALCRIGDRLFMQEQGRGLLEVKGDSLVPVPGGEMFADDQIIENLAFVSSMGEFSDGTILLSHSWRGLFVLDADGIREFPLLSPGPPDAVGLIGAMLPGDWMAIPTVRDALHLVDRSGRLVRLGRDDGLSDEALHATFVDDEGALWITSRFGISRLEWPSPSSAVNVDEGLAYDIRRHADRLFVSTTETVLRTENGKLVPVRATDGPPPREGYLAVVDDRLLLAGTSGLYEIRGREATRLIPTRIDSPPAVIRDPGQALAFASGGVISIVRRVDDRWEKEDLTTRLREPVVSIAQVESGELWLLPMGKDEIVRLRYDGPTTLVNRFRAGEIAPGLARRFAVVNDEIYLTAGAETYRIRRDDGVLTKVHELGPGLSSAYIVAVDADTGLVWLRQRDDPGREIVARVDAQGWEIVSEFRLESSVARSMTQASLGTDGVYWFGGNAGLLRFDSNVLAAGSVRRATLIRSVVVGDGRRLYEGTGPISPDIAVEWTANRIEIAYALTDYTDPEASVFQVKLEGVDDDYSDWREDSSVEYRNLAEGAYTFRVRGRTSSGLAASEAMVEFRVRPPWYRSRLTMALGALLLLTAGPVFHVVRTRSLRRRHDELEAMVELRAAQLREQSDELARLARIDPLTNAANRRSMTERIAIEVASARHSGLPLSVILCDIDHFKGINDNWGHDAGDEVLRAVVAVLESCVRQTDLVARWGGEEFLVLLVGSDVARALQLAERMRKAVEEVIVEHAGHRLTVTMTCGVAEIHGDTGPEPAIASADEALYRGKNEGRNRVVAASGD